MRILAALTLSVTFLFSLNASAQKKEQHRKPASIRYKVVSAKCELADSKTGHSIQDDVSIANDGKAKMLKSGETSVEIFIESDSLIIGFGKIGGNKKILFHGRSSDTSLSDFESNLVVRCDSVLTAL